MALKFPMFPRAEHPAVVGANTMQPAESADVVYPSKARATETVTTEARLKAPAKANGNATGGGVAANDTLERSVDFRLPVLGGLSVAQQIRVLLAILVASLALTAVFAFLNARNSVQNSTQTQIAGDALMHSQRIGKAAPNAIQGNAEAFKQLADSRSEFNIDLTVLEQGGTFKNRSIDAPSSERQPILQEVRTAWLNTDKAAVTMLKLQPELTGFGATLKKLNAQSPRLLDLTEQISSLKVQVGASPREISAAGQLVMLTQRLGRSANEFLTSEGVNPETAFLLGKDSNTFRTILEAFINGNEGLRLTATTDVETRQKLIELDNAFTEYQRAITAILGNLQNFVSAKQSEQLIFSENERLKQKLSTLQNVYRAEQDSLSWSFWALLIAALTALAAAGSTGLVILQDTRDRAREALQSGLEADSQRMQAQKQEEEAKGTNDQNQAAILRLMNELQEVADGDLTVQATVSEDITGAIADSVNYTVEELRGLVGRVTATAEQVTSASDQAQSISGELLSASQKQSREIQETGQAVLEMAVHITDVSKSANESAEVARQSVTAAEEGSKAVENAIKGMNEIREQIQETSKRIKRLGESSQEIGEITELISDITEQTNVLALNAAIQAASAGEAGRGFSVVAEEVQRLAERSGEATKQIGALVRTIQTDTHDAVAAMEKSTQGVVEGARLSDAAGAALSDIRRVSNQLAELIQSISSSTEQQATSANGVAQNIQNILTVTEQTQEGTQQTASSIRTLSKLAEELKNSVSRFRVSA
ncbi:MAG: methyl-accepting chemotaxis protein [Pseudomonadota bacterium]